MPAAAGSRAARQREPVAGLRLLTAVVVIAAAAVGFGISPTEAQTPPWQQPPVRQDGNSSGNLQWLPGRPVQAARVAEDTVSDVSQPPLRKVSHTTGAARAVAEDPVPEASDFANERPAPRGSAEVAPGYAPGYPADESLPSQPPAYWTEDGEECPRTAVFGFPCGFWRNLLQDSLWARTEYLMWWTRGTPIPPLLTTSPDGTAQAQAGTLDGPTTVLLGEHGLNEELRSGGRLSVGAWLDPGDNLGVEFVYLGIAQAADRLNANSSGSPTLARPFFNVTTGLDSSELIGYTNPAGTTVANGTFLAVSNSNMEAAELLMRRALCRGCGYRVELLAGYRFQRLDDGLKISDDFSNTVLFPAGSSLQQIDEFKTRNNFNGGELGIATAAHWCRWSLETSMKLALGNTRSIIDIEGQTTTTSPEGQAVTLGGFLAQPTNIGVHQTNQISMIPELDGTLAYDLTCRLRLTLGYSLIYWSDVARPGDQIDLNLTPPTATIAAVKPQFQLKTTDYWAQGLNFGLDFRF
jgi:hypothetical protein